MSHPWKVDVLLYGSVLDENGVWSGGGGKQTAFCVFVGICMFLFELKLLACFWVSVVDQWSLCLWRRARSE